MIQALVTLFVAFSGPQLIADFDFPPMGMRVRGDDLRILTGDRDLTIGTLSTVSGFVKFRRTMVVHDVGRLGGGVGGSFYLYEGDVKASTAPFIDGSGIWVRRHDGSKGRFIMKPPNGARAWAIWRGRVIIGDLGCQVWIESVPAKTPLRR